MKAVKGNRVYTITEAEKERRRSEGFDIYNDEGKLIAYARDKTVPYEQYAALEKELEALKSEKETQKAQKSGKKE